MTDADVRWGYTLADLTRLARIAVAGAHYQGTDYRDRHAAAWDAIIDMLYEAEEYPAPAYLVGVGIHGVDHAMRTSLYARGDHKRHERGGPPAAFQRYWWGSRITPSPEEGVVERTTLRQIWPRLAPRHQRALVALAVHEDYARAAEALGLTYHSLCHNVRAARAVVLALWHEGEEPSRVWMRDRRVWRRDVAEPAEHRPVTVRLRASQRRKAAKR